MPLIDEFETTRIETFRFPTTPLAEHLGDADQRVAATVYSGTFLVIAVLFNVRLWYALRSGRVANAPEHSRALARQYALGPPLYAVLFLVGTINATVCLVLSGLLAIYF